MFVFRDTLMKKIKVENTYFYSQEINNNQKEKKRLLFLFLFSKKKAYLYSAHLHESTDFVWV